MMTTQSDKLRRRGDRLVRLQALAVAALIAAALFFLLDYRQPAGTSVVKRQASHTFLNLDNPALPQREQWLRWLDSHDPGLFSRSDRRQGYLALLPDTARRLPHHLGAERFVKMELPPIPRPAATALRLLGGQPAPAFTSYQPGALQGAGSPLPPARREVAWHWRGVDSPPAPPMLQNADRLKEPLLLRFHRAAGADSPVRIEPLRGGDPELNAELFLLLLPELETRLKPGTEAELLVLPPEAAS